jgi:hypothetical protein
MKIDFEFSSQYGKFSDALYFDDNAVPDEATIEALKQERFQNWLNAIENPPVEEPLVETPQEEV